MTTYQTCGSNYGPLPFPPTFQLAYFSCVMHFLLVVMILFSLFLSMIKYTRLVVHALPFRHPIHTYSPNPHKSSHCPDSEGLGGADMIRLDFVMVGPT